MLALLLALVLPASAVQVQAPGLPGALHASPLGAWKAGTAAPPPKTSEAPLLRAMELRGLTPAGFEALDAAAKEQALKQADADVRAEAAAEAAALIAAAGDADLSSPEFLVLTARLAELDGPLAAYAPEETRAQIRFFAQTTRHTLSKERQTALALRLELMSRSLGHSHNETAVEHAAAHLARVPAEMMTPGVARLRAAAQAPSKALIRPTVETRPAFQDRLDVVAAKYRAKSFLSRRLYRPVIQWGQNALIEIGHLLRAYVLKTEPHRHPYRWMVMNDLHKKGDFRGAFGHQVYAGDVKILSDMNGDDDRPSRLARQVKQLRGATLTPSLGISGMSFPQLTAQSHLSLLYIDLRLAKEQGVRMLHNTGEGSPHLLLGLIEGDAAKLKAGVIEWNRANGQMPKGSWDEAEVAVLVDRLMKERDELFKDFTAEDLSRAQIVAQFGGGLNGIRRDDDEGRIDYDKLAAIARNPAVAMVQYKLKQAAKRGAKVDPSKMDALSGFFRELPRKMKVKSPEVIAEMGDARAIAAMVQATRALSDKPVSLKFAVGDVRDTFQVMKYLKEHNALPDHIQIDGAGREYSPGSGNAPPEADTSLPADQAIIAFDAMLKKLGVRDRIFVDVSGEILWPVDAVHKLALGADGVCAARGWMGMGLGCAMAKKCDGKDGQCPWGIASAGNSMTGLSLDPVKVAPKGYAAALNWHKEYVKMLSEAKVENAWQARSVLGLSNPYSAVHVLDQDKWAIPLDRAYPRQKVIDLLRGVLTPKEVDALVYGK